MTSSAQTSAVPRTRRLTLALYRLLMCPAITLPEQEDSWVLRQLVLSTCHLLRSRISSKTILRTTATFFFRRLWLQYRAILATFGAELLRWRFSL